MKFFTQAYKTLKLYRIIGYSRKSNLFGINPLVISVAFLLITELIWSFTRGFIKRGFEDGFLRRLVLEFIATAELCAACFELIIVADNYGVWTYALFLFVLTVYWSFSWGEATATPYLPVEGVLEGKESILKAILLIVVHVLGGLSIYRYIQVMWSLELAETHKGRAFEECTADLQVSMIAGAFVEGLATCTYRVISKILGETNTKVANILDAFFSTLMVVAAFNYTGGYLNPALATSLKYGCHGNTLAQHLVVYWLGATLGAIGSVFVFRTRPIQSIVKRLTRKQD